MEHSKPLKLHMNESSHTSLCSRPAFAARCETGKMKFSCARSHVFSCHSFGSKENAALTEEDSRNKSSRRFQLWLLRLRERAPQGASAVLQPFSSLVASPPSFARDSDQTGIGWITRSVLSDSNRNSREFSIILFTFEINTALIYDWDNWPSRGL
jgi:hypothetical protein